MDPMPSLPPSLEVPSSLEVLPGASPARSERTKWKAPSAARSARSGFTLLEVVIVISLMLGLLMLGIPAIRHMIHRTRVMAVARETSQLMQRSRLEAIRRGVPVVVTADYDEDRLFAYADVNDAANNPVSDLVFNPQAGAPDGGTDYPVGSVELTWDIEFWGAGDIAAEGTGAIAGFSAPGAGSGPNVAVFESDGTIRDIGSVRFADSRDNFFEVRVFPRATARMAVRKFDSSRTAQPAPDGTKYFESKEGGMKWKWD